MEKIGFLLRFPGQIKLSRIFLTNTPIQISLAWIQTFNLLLGFEEEIRKQIELGFYNNRIAITL